jgi:hypothetical protein
MNLKVNFYKVIVLKSMFFLDFTMGNKKMFFNRRFRIQTGNASFRIPWGQIIRANPSIYFANAISTPTWPYFLLQIMPLLPSHYYPLNAATPSFANFLLALLLATKPLFAPFYGLILFSFPLAPSPAMLEGSIVLVQQIWTSTEKPRFSMLQNCG